jgi:hypothetical protein
VTESVDRLLIVRKMARGPPAATHRSTRHRGAGWKYLKALSKWAPAAERLSAAAMMAYWVPLTVKPRSTA